MQPLDWKQTPFQEEDGFKTAPPVILLPHYIVKSITTTLQQS